MRRYKQKFAISGNNILAGLYLDLQHKRMYDNSTVPLGKTVFLTHLRATSAALGHGFVDAG